MTTHLIHSIRTQTEYGKQGTYGLIAMRELTSDGLVEYAHSKDEALAYVKSFSAFANVAPASNGSTEIFATAWSELDELFRLMHGPADGVTHSRMVVEVSPVKTVSTTRYTVTATTEYDNGETYVQEPLTYLTREQAVAHAEDITKAKEENGVFAGDWQRNWQLSFIDDSGDDSGDDKFPAQLRITARIETE